MKGKIHVNGIDLHYEEQGSGPTIIFVHGNLADYRYWQPYLKPLARTYRVVAYSRRYNYPNQNQPVLPDYSVLTDVGDLVVLIQTLDLAPVHLIGHAYGALVALTLACEQPALVRSLVVSEPPLLRWLADLSGGPAVYAEYEENLWRPVRQAFEQNNGASALRLTMDYLAGEGAFNRMAVEQQQGLGQNLAEWQAVVLAANAFSLPSLDQIKHLSMPFLSLTGENSAPWQPLINTELEQLVPHSKRITIPHVGAEMWEAVPERCREIILEFLANYAVENENVEISEYE